jgi:hypothetical protein
VRRECLKLPKETSLCYRPILVREAAKEGHTRVLQRADDLEILLLFTRGALCLKLEGREVGALGPGVLGCGGRTWPVIEVGLLLLII